MQYNLAPNEPFLIKRGEVTVEVPLEQNGTLATDKGVIGPEITVSDEVATISCVSGAMNTVNLESYPGVSAISLDLSSASQGSDTGDFYLSVVVPEGVEDVPIELPSNISGKDSSGRSVKLVAQSGKQTTFHLLGAGDSGSGSSSVVVEGANDTQQQRGSEFVDPIVTVSGEVATVRCEDGALNNVSIDAQSSVSAIYLEFPEVTQENVARDFYLNVTVDEGMSDIPIYMPSSVDIKDSSGNAPYIYASPGKTSNFHFRETRKAPIGDSEFVVEGANDIQQKGSVGSGDTRVPFLVYSNGDGDDSDDSAGELYMYLPAGSLTIGGQEVVFEGVDGNRFPVEDDTTYWCEIFRTDGSDEDSSAEDGDNGDNVGCAKYVASISSSEEPSDDVALRFKVTETRSAGNCNQLVFGAVTLGPLPDYKHLVPWQVVHVDYEDDKKTSKLYRMFLPDKGSLSYNGFTLPIKEAERGWYELPDGIGKENSTLKYYCVIFNLEAHLFEEQEFKQFMDAHANEQESIQARFLAVEVNSGGGGGGLPSDETSYLNAKSLIVTLENGCERGEPLSRPGANADAQMWSSVFANMSSSENIMRLADGQASLPSVTNAVGLVCDTDGMTVFMISTHGAPDGSMCVYNGLLTPAVLAANFARSKGPVWFIADCCYSGRAVSGAAPGGGAARLITDIGNYMRENAPSVPYLGWACTQPDTFGWTMQDGSYFTKSCYRHIRAGCTYAEVWEAVSTDPSVTMAEIPCKVVANGFQENQVIYGTVGGGK